MAAVTLSAVALLRSSPCAAQGEPPTIVGYGFQGFGTGVGVGLAAGYLATGPTWESDEWRTLLWGAGVGALTGLGVGLVLGVVDAGSGTTGPGVGYYMLRDSNYGVSVGALAGGVVGGLIWLSDGTGKDLLRGLAWGAVIGAGSGFVLGIIEGALRTKSSAPSRDEHALNLNVGFVPSQAGPPLPYASLDGRF